MLYLIATPIGNLQDFTFRAVNTLKKVDYILCEDTRHSQILLKRYDVNTPLVSYHKFNEQKSLDKILSDLKGGKELALISDAGTIGVCDPGERLVQACSEEKLPYTQIPGPCAFISALVLCSFSRMPYQFVGFLERRQLALESQLKAILQYSGVTACYESPRRLIKTLKLIATVFPKARCAIARELTKKFEEVLEGSPEELLKIVSSRKKIGECVLIIAGGEKIIDNDLSIEEHTSQLMKDQKLSEKEAIRELAKLKGLSRREIYKRLKVK